MNDAPRTPLDTFLDGVEEDLRVEEGTPWIVYGPKWARAEGASEPPAELNDPVWSPSTGWMEKGKAPIHKDGSGECLALYAPDELEVDGPSKSG